MFTLVLHKVQNSLPNSGCIGTVTKSSVFDDSTEALCSADTNKTGTCTVLKSKCFYVYQYHRGRAETGTGSLVLPVAGKIHSLKNVVCYRKDKAAGRQFLPSPCELDATCICLATSLLESSKPPRALEGLS